MMKKNRTLTLIILVSVLPIAAAYLMYFTGVGVPDNTVNNGVLLQQPMNIKQLFTRESSREFVEGLDREKKWRLLIPVNANCDRACQENLYTTRQVHIRLADKSDRLERLAVNLGAGEDSQFLQEVAKEHPLLKISSVETSEWQAWLGENQAELNRVQQPYYFLVDQEGFAMMFYTANVHGNLLLKDIKRALKYSIDYR